MFNLINIVSNVVGYRNANFKDNASLNLLDIGCSSFIPDHFTKYAKLIHYLGCDPDYIGIQNVKSQKYLKNFRSNSFINVGASNVTKKSLLEVSSKRTGSKIVQGYSKRENLFKVNLLETAILQKKFSNGSANLIKIDVEGHELEVVKGANLSCQNLLAVEVECTLNQNNNNLSTIISELENNKFFLASIKYHNAQTFNLSIFHNKISRNIYRVLSKIPFVKRFNENWTDLSGKSSFSANKSFLKQIELIFLKKKSHIKNSHISKYNNILIIYGFLRHLNNLKGSNLNKFMINNFPSR